MDDTSLIESDGCDSEDVGILCVVAYQTQEMDSCSFFFTFWGSKNAREEPFILGGRLEFEKCCWRLRK